MSLPTQNEHALILSALLIICLTVTPTPADCPTADLTGDCRVNLLDFALVAEQWLNWDCLPGWADCDGDPDNECETNTHSNLANCGACNQTCSLPNTTAHDCVNGNCTVVTCSAGYDNCDANHSNGCEANLNTNSSHCGACNNNCLALPHVTGASCTAAACQISTCDTGFCDLDGQTYNGCEFNLASDPPCANYTHIGSVSGDDVSATLHYADVGEKWFRVQLTEDVTSGTCIYLSATVVLQPALGTDYDLYVYCDGCQALAGYSNLSGSNYDTVQVRWDEECSAGFDDGSDATGYFFIFVKYYSDSRCEDYQLIVTGNTSVLEETCLTP